MHLRTEAPFWLLAACFTRERTRERDTCCQSITDFPLTRHPILATYRASFLFISLHNSRGVHQYSTGLHTAVFAVYKPPHALLSKLLLRLLLLQACSGAAPAYKADVQRSLRGVLTACRHILAETCSSLADATDGEDLLPAMLRGSFREQGLKHGSADLSGFHTAILWAGASIVAVGESCKGSNLRVTPIFPMLSCSKFQGRNYPGGSKCTKISVLISMYKYK